MYHARYEKPRKTTPPKKAETYSSSNAVAQNLEEKVLLNCSSIIKRKETKSHEKTNWHRMAKITREKFK